MTKAEQARLVAWLGVFDAYHLLQFLLSNPLTAMS